MPVLRHRRGIPEVETRRDRLRSCVSPGHVFEAWFGSSNAYEEQRAAGLVACPIAARPVSQGGDGADGRCQGQPSGLATRRHTGPSRNQSGDGRRSPRRRPRRSRIPEWVAQGLCRSTRARCMSGSDPAAPIHGQATREEARASGRGRRDGRAAARSRSSRPRR